MLRFSRSVFGHLLLRGDRCLVWEIGDRFLGERGVISPCNSYDLQIALRTLRICIEGSDSISDKEGNN